MSTLYIALDDTDIPTSTGTGHLARAVAAMLATRFRLLGVTRHQLLFDSRIPMTAKNSANTVHLQSSPVSPADQASLDLAQLADEVAGLMLARFQPGSDPGLCLAIDPPLAVTEFGRRAKTTLVTAEEARTLATATHHLILRSLGGDGSGVIGALAAVGLAASGNDGRFNLVGTVRDLQGRLPVAAIVAAGITRLQTTEGQVVTSGLVDTGNKLRPALIEGQAVLLVEPVDGLWRATRRD